MYPIRTYFFQLTKSFRTDYSIYFPNHYFNRLVSRYGNHDLLYIASLM